VKKQHSDDVDVEERNQIAQANWDAYQRALDAGHSEYVTSAAKQDNFYRGEQWDEGLKAKLESEGRPALTINAVKPAVNAVLGEYSSQRADITYKATGMAQDEIGDALTKVGRQVQHNNKYSIKEGMVFADGLIQDRGYFDIRMGFDDSMQGEIVITEDDPIDVMPDPTAKSYDPKDWKEVTKTRWVPLEDIELHYGKEKANQLKAIDGDMSYGQDSVRYYQQTFGDVDIYDMSNYEGARIRRVRLIERQFFKMRRVEFFVDLNTGDMRQVPDNWPEEKVKQFAEQNQLGIIPKVAKNIRWTVTADHIVLHDGWSPYKTFTIIPYFPYWRRGKPTGMVRDMISPQEQLNKTESQQLHIVNTTANSGWMVESGSLQNMTEQELEERGAETGLVVVYNKGRQAPIKIEPNQVPTGLDRLSSKSLQYLRETAGVNNLLGTESAEVSGVALGKQQARGVTQMQVPFDNLHHTRLLVGEKILELIQQFYTETRLFRVTNFATIDQEQEEVVINGMSPEGNIINNVTLGEYDVIASSSPARDTFAESQFAEALNLRNAGIAIPDHWVIMYSHLSDKTAVAKEVRDMQGMGEPTEQEMELAQLQQQMEIEGAQLELQKLGAEIQDLQADVMLKQAKAQSEVGELQLAAKQQQIDAQLRLGTLQGTFTSKMADLQNKIKLAEIHTRAKNAESLYANASKRATAEMTAKATGLTAMAVERERGKNKPAPSAK
jgi:hypothetical protein